MFKCSFGDIEPCCHNASEKLLLDLGHITKQKLVEDHFLSGIQLELTMVYQSMFISQVDMIYNDIYNDALRYAK